MSYHSLKFLPMVVLLLKPYPKLKLEVPVQSNMKAWSCTVNTPDKLPKACHYIPVIEVRF